jgi:hypothetical protein
MPLPTKSTHTSRTKPYKKSKYCKKTHQNCSQQPPHSAETLKRMNNSSPNSRSNYSSSKELNTHFFSLLILCLPCSLPWLRAKNNGAQPAKGRAADPGPLRPILRYLTGTRCYGVGDGRLQLRWSSVTHGDQNCGIGGVGDGRLELQWSSTAHGDQNCGISGSSRHREQWGSI